MILGKSTVERARKLRDELSGDLDAEFRESYRKILFGQYQGMNISVQDPQAKAEADAITTIEKEDIKWEDLYRLELAIIRLESPEELKRHSWILRQEYTEIASSDEIKQYYESKPPDPATGDAVALRFDCIRIQEELNWHYIVIWVLEELRSRLTKRVLLWTLSVLITAFLLFLGLQLMPQSIFFNFPILALIMVPGIVGGLISTIMRIQKVRLDGNADLAMTQLDEGNASVIISPFLGGIFAFLLFCLFAGKFINGNLLPTVSFGVLTGDIHPDSDEIAKLLVWCFLAGFSEKIIPDRLDKLSKELEQK